MWDMRLNQNLIHNNKGKNDNIVFLNLKGLGSNQSFDTGYNEKKS